MILEITRWPDRKGWYLCLTEGNRSRAIARFVNKEAADALVEYLVQRGAVHTDAKETE